MTSQIETKKLFEFCKIPPEELVNHPESKVKLHVYEKKQDATCLCWEPNG